VFDIGEWVYRTYVYPIIYDTSYNPVDTVTWAVVLGIAVFILARLLGHLHLKIDKRLLESTIPFILAGSSLRVIEDAGLVSPPASYLLITPLIFFVVFLVTFSSLLLARKLLGPRFLWGYAGVGLIWAALNLSILWRSGFQNPWVAAAVLVLGTGLTAGLLLARRKIPWLGFLDDRDNLLIVYAHMLDASSTYIGVDWFSYYEKHVVPTFLIDLTGSAAIMFPLKLIVLLPALSLIDRSIENRSLKNMTKLALITLGLAPAIRNTLRLAMGV